MTDYTKFNLQEFVNWVAQQPPDMVYDGGDLNACALAQFGYPKVAGLEAHMMGLYENDLYAMIVAPRVNGAVADLSTFGILSNALREAGYEPQL